MEKAKTDYFRLIVFFCLLIFSHHPLTGLPLRSCPLSSSLLPSIFLKQITICLQPLGHTPQLFWIQLRIYLYQTMQRAGVSDLRLGVLSVYPTVQMPELHTR